MIQIREIHAPDGLKEFIKFSFHLYKDNPYWVPALIGEECDNLNREVNPAFQHAEVWYFMAYKNEMPVGRMAVIINHKEVNLLQNRKLRFGWFDVVDDLEVSRALIDKAIEIGKKHDLAYIEGPMGFSNMDKAGVLVEGFDEMNTLISWYNHPYYESHFQKMGFEIGSEWVEFKLKIPEKPLEKVVRFSKIIQERNKVSIYKFKSKKDILDHADEMFGLLNKTYSVLKTFIPIEGNQIAYYKKKYFPYLNPEFVICLKDQNDKIISFAIMMPSLSKALKKANGSLFPFGWFYLWRENKYPKEAEFYLIGVDPEYQNKGLTAIIFKEVNDLFARKGIRVAETNPELVENKAIQALWKDYNGRLHKRRRTYRKDI
ncbi:MAG: GNAT family N-acetyltransferase [Flavobacteriaceae bacterium]|nr:GNAT family N-acetyltransferase [Flavobacteriaceae bacterium]